MDNLIGVILRIESNLIMAILFPDTDPKAERVLLELLRREPAWRKLEMVGQMNEAVRTLALNGLRSHYPNDSPDRLHRRLADLLLGPELAAKVYGPLEIGVNEHAS
jgi:hypothetical protein